MKIKVGIKDYEIIKKLEIVEVGGEYYGKHDGDQQTITIASKFSQLIQNQAFLHELLHAVSLMQDLREINENEHWIELLAKGLYLVIKENPHIFSMINITNGD